MSWADQFNTYEEACRYYGCDTPAQIKAEMDEEVEEHRLMEAAFGPYIFPAYLFPDLPF